jgi:hypothetical protein
MQAFAAPLERLVLTSSRNAKLRLICGYLRHTTDPSRGWALAAITDEELVILDKYVRHHTIERYGPVRSVTAASGRPRS